MKILKIILLLFVLAPHRVHSKILLITHAYNRPEFIPLQDATFKKFLLDDYEFVVFNDARDPNFRKQIFDVCQTLGLRGIGISQEIHDRPYLKRASGENPNSACCRCATVVQYSLDEIGFKHDDIVVIVDSDLFLIKKFSIRDYMKNYAISAVDQQRGHVHYLWNCLVFFDMPALPAKNEINFNCGSIEGQSTDVGGYMYYYLQKFPDLPINFINQWHMQEEKFTKDQLISKGLNKKTLNFMEKPIPDSVFMLDATFLHYQSGTNWNGNDPEYHKNKFKKLKDFINHIIS